MYIGDVLIFNALAMHSYTVSTVTNCRQYSFVSVGVHGHLCAALSVQSNSLIIQLDKVSSCCCV